MTAPVEQKGNSEKIAMTAPVEQIQSGDKFTVSFMMPAKYTLDTLPEPLDPNVRLREVPAQKVATVRYSGTWSQKRYEKKRDALRQFVAERGLRRNEVLIPVE